LPEQPLAGSGPLQLNIEIEKGFPLVPGCMVRTMIDFRWHGRIISGAADYHTRSRHAVLSLSSLRRGDFTSSGPCFEIADAAGFFRFRLTAGAGGGLIVNPSPRFDASFPGIMGIGGENLSRTIRKKRSDELTESRQYYPGDDVRRINWRTFAHTGQLFIRLGEELPNPESHLLIITDLSGSDSGLLKPERLDPYLDYIVDSLAGIIEKLGDAGINVECIFPQGKPAADTAAALAPLWWDDAEIPPSVIKKKKHGGCLIICPAFSLQAGRLCSQAAGAGMSVNVMVPVPPGIKPAGRSLLRRLIFKAVKDDAGFSELLPSAEGLMSGLRELKGVVSAEII